LLGLVAGLIPSVSTHRLVKLVLFQRRREEATEEQQPADGPPRLGFGDEERKTLGASAELSFHCPELGGDLHFFVFQTKQVRA
jgi:hypothetical protein